MDDNEASRSIYEAFAGPTRGREIDVRPDPAGVRARDETTALRRPASKLVLDEEVAARPRDWPEGHTTGAFVSAAASIRHEVKPYRWWDRISPAMLFVWCLFLGAPVVAGVWAGIVLWDRLRHG